MKRRQFLHVAVVGASGVAACVDETLDPRETAAQVFPQGVASGDPTPTSIILWTRVSSGGGGEAVAWALATDEAMTAVIASGTVETGPELDHTVRIKIDGLEAYTVYHYRFTVRGVTSPTGRTKTAPAPDDDVEIRFAFASCQDFNGRYYHAWQVLLDEEEDLDFVVHLGDYVYETTGDPQFQSPTEGRAIVVPDGKPLGDEETGTFEAALTLADYRALYKQYRSDPHLQEAHRRYPFICIWDDHEFANDCWQDHSTDFDEAQGPEQDTPRREAATQAWFEYQPADVPYDPSAAFPQDIRIWRALRFGRHVELFLTDQRYYRADHLVPEGPVDVECGHVFQNSEIGSRILVKKSCFDPREAAALPSMLGFEQRDWLVEAMNASAATWKLWCSETMVSQMTVDLSDVTSLPEEFQDRFYFGVDAWDGFRSERRQILQGVQTAGNVVVLTGDIHAFYAAEVHLDFDMPGEPVAVEYVVGGISSLPVAKNAEQLVCGDPALEPLLCDVAPEFDMRLAADSPHFKYTNSFDNGIALCHVTEGELQVTFLQVKDDVSEPGYTGAVDRASFRTVSGTNRVAPL
jgi:alkaline phosphatase D